MASLPAWTKPIVAFVFRGEVFCASHAKARDAVSTCGRGAGGRRTDPKTVRAGGGHQSAFREPPVS